MIEKEQRKMAKLFAKEWEGKGNEKSDAQKFWLELLRDVYGIEKPEQYIDFEERVMLDHTSFIDGYISETHVLIEQKSLGRDLNAKIIQSDKSELTPFEQAKRYNNELPYSKKARWIITSNFSEFNVYDMENPHGEPQNIRLKDLGREFYRMNFLVSKDNTFIKKEMELSLKAGQIVGELYDVFEKEYKENNIENYEQHLNMLCVRLVFCLYAEDSGIFGKKNMFHDYLNLFDASHTRKALKDLFRILNTKVNERDPFEEPELLKFPYVNGGLFEQEITIPYTTEEIKALLLAKASDEFDWSEISPTIFGAVFESTLNPETRRAGGIHYTSIENIHKVIDPLFLDDLKAELEDIKQYKDLRTIIKKVKEYQDKLTKLKFLDPACGSGNFLTETYICIRKLENEAIRLEQQGEINLFDPIRVSISQFFGIEVNDFAVEVAKTALWIAESQMMRETEEIFNIDLEFLPLKTNAFIVCDNSLTCDWNSVIPSDEVTYIIGNPPFVGSKYTTEIQKQEMDAVFKGSKINYRKLDYVACWWYLATKYAINTNAKISFVSTNSITQGEQVEPIWSFILNRGYSIEYAYKTFVWDSESNSKAHVHCVIVGISKPDKINKKTIFFDNGLKSYVENINPYLSDAPDVVVTSRNKTLVKGILPMTAPNKPCDYNQLKIEASDYDNFISNEPNSEKWIKRMVGAEEFINNKKRYCLWLVGIDPLELQNMPLVMDRVDKCREKRLEAKTSESLKLAKTPTLFREQINPEHYLLIPCVSSEKRQYIPIGYLDKETIPVMGTLIIPDAPLYYFGVLTSSVHMAWMRAVAGRLKSDYRYSKDIVYNNFPWVDISDDNIKKIEKTAQNILNARANHPDSTLANMYGEHMYLYTDLVEAHQENDKAVLEAFGFKVNTSESQIVKQLFERYESLTK